MKSRLCICCGQPMPEEANPLSRNPNVCLSCARLKDELEEAGEPEPLRLAQHQPPPYEREAEDREAA